MKTVDSNTKQLEPAQVVTMSIQQQLDAGLGADIEGVKITLPMAMAYIHKESNMPTADMKQFGNTVFLSHIVKDGGSGTTRALNVDTGKNFIRNSTQFLLYMQKKKVKIILAPVDSKQYVDMLNANTAELAAVDIAFRVGSTSSGKDILIFLLDGRSFT